MPWRCVLRQDIMRGGIFVVYRLLFIRREDALKFDQQPTSQYLRKRLCFSGMGDQEYEAV